MCSSDLALGGGAAGWRAVAIIYCIVGIITNTLSCFSVKELSEEELRDGEINEEDSKLTLGQTFKLLVSNKYFLMIVVIYILQQLRADCSAAEAAILCHRSCFFFKLFSSGLDTHLADGNATISYAPSSVAF